MSGTARAALGAALGAALLVSTPAATGVQDEGERLARLAASVRAGVTVDGLDARVRAIVQHDRLSGGPGERAAIDHIVSTLEADGIPVELHEFDAFLSDPLSASVEIPAAGLRPQANTVSFSAAAEGLEAEVVDVGALPDLDPSTGELLALAGSIGVDPGEVAREMLPPGIADLDGKIALIDGTPVPDVAWRLEQLGAAGAIFVNPEEKLNELVVTTVWGAPSLRDAHRIPEIVVTQVKHSDGGAIREQLEGGAVRARLTTRLRTGWRPLTLALARIPATDSDAPFVLFGGHIDSWFHGAIDEGASNAAMVELARAFWRHRDELRRGLWVAWWPGHSNGRYAGSTWFADHFFTELERRALAYLNVDGIGQIDADRFSASATAALEPLALEVARERTGREIRVGRPGRNSDQAFNGVGLPLLQFNQSRPRELGGYWWWHTAEDTIDKVDPVKLKEAADLYVDAIVELLAARVLPVDPVAEVEALGARIAALQAEGAGRFDLTEALDAQRDLLRDLVALQRALGAGDEPIDRALVRILRPLYRVQFTLAGPYHPDPAVSLGLLPGLAPIRALAGVDRGTHRDHVLRTTLVRERNRLLDALARADRETGLLYDDVRGH